MARCHVPEAAHSRFVRPFTATKLAAPADAGCPGSAAPRAPRAGRSGRLPGVDLGRIAWLTTVAAALITAVLLLVSGYDGYGVVALAVAASAAINLR